MAYYDALIAKWGTLSGTTAQKLAAVNALTVAGPNVDVPVSAVEGYMSLNGLLTAIEDWLATNPSAGQARTSAKELLRTIASPHVSMFQMSDPTTYATVQGMLNALAATPTPALLTNAQVTALMALAATTIPWWQATVAQGGGGLNSPPNGNDLTAAGLS